MRFDPHMRGFVFATAFVTSLMFALAAWIPVGLALRWLLSP